MFILSRKKYQYLIPATRMEILSFNKTEAEAYFQWFVGKVPERVTYISDVCARDLHIPRERLDYSPESLLLIWKWFRKRAKVVRRKENRENSGKFSGGAMDNTHVLSAETEYLLVDVAMYLAETFIKNFDNIYWSYYMRPANNMSRYPVLMGFIGSNEGKPVKLPFQPLHMVETQAAKLLSHNSHDGDLLMLYRVWEEKALNGSEARRELAEKGELPPQKLQFERKGTITYANKRSRAIYAEKGD